MNVLDIQIIFGFLLAVVVGTTLGLMGSGGTILTVPILVYVMGVDPVLATTYSLFAVGITAAIGAIRSGAQRNVDFEKVVVFGLPSLLTVFLTRTFVLPLVPEVFIIGTREIHQAVVLMVIFSAVMFTSAVSMIYGGDLFIGADNRRMNGRRGYAVVQGVAVGFVTGVVGAGGGFLIIPVMIQFFQMSIQRAVGTSLVIIAVNAIFGVLGDIEKLGDIDWPLLGGYTFFTIAGMLIGFFLSNRIPGGVLKKMFGYLILSVGLYVLFKEVVSLYR